MTDLESPGDVLYYAAEGSVVSCTTLHCHKLLEHDTLSDRKMLTDNPKSSLSRYLRVQAVK